MSKKVIAKVQVGDEILALTNKFQWISDEEDSDLPEQANQILQNYEYSPAHGEPGIYLAEYIAKIFKGKIIMLMKHPEYPEDLLIG